MPKGQISIGRKSTLTERVYEMIKRGIVRGEIEEGIFLSEAAFLRKYGVGRTPFREACIRLHNELLLEVMPRRGCLVPELSLRTAREIFQARIVLEAAVAELAAVNASPAQIDKLEELIQPVRVPDSSEAGIRANTEFHLELARMTHNRELVKLVTGLLERSERIWYMLVRTSPEGWAAFDLLHAPIVKALRKQDPQAAREAIVKDIAHGRNLLVAGDTKGESTP